MEFPIKMVPFSGHVNFAGVYKGEVTHKHIHHLA